MSYSVRRYLSVRSRVSKIAQFDRGSLSRGCPTDPGLIRTLQPDWMLTVLLNSRDSGASPCRWTPIIGTCVWPLKQMLQHTDTENSLPASSGPECMARLPTGVLDACTTLTLPYETTRGRLRSHSVASSDGTEARPRRCLPHHLRYFPSHTVDDRPLVVIANDTRDAPGANQFNVLLPIWAVADNIADRLNLHTAFTVQDFQ